MVNCKNCGAPLTLEDAVCPHCGTANPEAQEHLKKLARLNKDYQKTKTEVVSEVRKNKKGYGVLTVLIVVLLANLLLIPLHASSYSIADSIIASRRSKVDVKQQLDTYIQNQEYEQFVITYDKYCEDYRSFREYSRLYYLAYQFMNVKEYVTDYYFAKELYTDALVRGCQSIVEYRDEYDRYLKYDDDDPYIKEAAILNEQFELFIRTFLKLTDEDIAGLSGMSESELLVLVSQRLNNEE